LKRILNLQPGIMSRYFSSSEFIDSKELVNHADLFISTGYVDDFLIHKPLILFHPLSKSVFTTGSIVQKVKPYIGDGTNPVMHYLRFPRLSINKAVLLKESKRAISLLLSEEGTLISAIDDGKVKQAVSGFSLDNSSFDSDVAFPVFIVNSLKWILGDGLKMARWYKTGDRLNLPVDIMKKMKQDKLKVHFSLTAFSSLKKNFQGVNGSIHNNLNSLEIPLPRIGLKHDSGLFNKSGIYSITLSKGDTTRFYQRFPVSVLDSGESDLRRSSSVAASSAGFLSSLYKKSNSDTLMADNKSQWSGKEYYSWFAKAFLCLLLVEWFLFSRKGG
jgi:hypothetical protein